MKNDLSIEEIKFPIGKFVIPQNITKNDVLGWIETLNLFADRLKNLKITLDEQQLNYKYRVDGWTIKQIIHHCADSHINSFIRFKLS